MLKDFTTDVSISLVGAGYRDKGCH
jgi:hypothetical protein